MKRALLVGAGNMGRGLATHARASGSVELVGVCDVVPSLAHGAGEEFGVPSFTNLDEALRATHPDFTIVATQTAAHVDCTLQSIAFGVRGVYCEKPMAMDLGSARKVVAAAQESGTRVVVNHQRRMLAEMTTARQLIDDGAIGDVYMVRGSNAGDVLSDGTHCIDSLRFLLGDIPAKRVTAHLHRKKPDPSEPRSSGFKPSGGYRYGHPVEDGGMAVIEFEGGVRAEGFFGDMMLNGRWYQDYEVFGTKGRIWRKTDGQEPRLLIQDEAGGFRTVDVGDATVLDVLSESIAKFAEVLDSGAPHPLDLSSGFADQEIVMAIYESARLGHAVDLPLQQDRFPLEVWIEERGY